MRAILKECVIGFMWAACLIIILFVHYAMCIDIPEFRYIGF